MNLRRAHFANHGEAQSRAGSRRRSALTLLEMMVSMTLLALIMVGLLTMFSQTQKALHLANTQTDVFENARGAVQIVTRDLTEMAAFDDTNVVNFYATPVQNPVFIYSPPGGVQPSFDEAFWLSRANNEWQGIGYFVEGASFGVGTLYRFSGTVRQEHAGELLTAFTSPNPTNAHRVSDGIVHFHMEAVYVTNTGPALNPVVSFERANSFTFPKFVTEITPSTNAGPAVAKNISILLPAYVDLEIGVLEPATLKRFQALTNDLDVSIPEKFLRNHTNEIHFFRERVPIRNFINPYRSHEVP